MNILSKYNEFLLEHSDVDPYGEEKWYDGKDIDVLWDIANELNLNPSKIRKMSDNTNEFIFKKDGWYFYVFNNSKYGDNTITIRFGKLSHLVKILNRLTKDEFEEAYTDLLKNNSK